MDKRGQPIRGSSLYREYCHHCGEPIRVRQGQLGQEVYCQDCDGSKPPPAHAGLCKRQRTKLGKTDG